MKSRTRQGLLLVVLVVVLLSTVFQMAQSAATISTDRKTYSVGAQITITGAGFTPGAYIYVKVERPDHLVDDIVPTPLSNASGGFTVVYQPPLISGRYKISATDGTSTTTTAATEADAVGFNKNGYVKGTFVPEDQTGNWSSGNQGQKYNENQWTFDQYEITGISSAADVPSFDIFFNHYQSATGAIFIDALANFRACVDCTSADGAVNSGPNAGMLDDTHPLPPNNNANWKVLPVQVPGGPAVPGAVISHPNRPLNSAANGTGSVVLGGQVGFCSSDNREPVNTPAEFHCFHVDGTNLAALFTTQLNSAGNHTISISYNGHLAASFVWGNGSAGIGGHEASVGDCNSIYYARPYTASAQTQQSSFEPHTGDGCNSTGIPIYGADDYAGWTSASFGVGFASGSSRHWSMANQTSGPSGAIEIPIPTVQTPSNTIVIVKQTSPSNATATFNFTGTFGPFSLSNPFPSSRTFTDIAAGVEYDVTESALAGWNLTNLACAVTAGTDDGTGSWPTGGTNSTAQIILGSTDNGVTLTCTYTNAGLGHIIVHKVTNPASDTTTSFAYTTTGSGYNGFSLVGGGQNDSGGLASGNYTVSETAKSGWDLTSLTCDTQTGVTINGAQASIALTPGETVNCTYTNTKRAHIIVNKHTQPSPNPFDASFTFTTTGTGYSTFTLKDGGSNTDGASPPTNGLTPGTYTIKEEALSDWILSSRSCVSASGASVVPTGLTQPGSITLAAGDTVTCDYTNNWPDANVTIGTTAVNEVGHQHVFTITVNAVTDGLGTPTFKSITPSVTPTAGLTTNTNTCATPTLSNGGLTATCTLTINSSTPGVYTANAAAVVTIGGVDFSRATGDGKGSVTPDGPAATKTYVDAKIALSPLNATNGITQAHTITATVSQDKGDGAGFVAAPNGTLVTFSLLNNTAGATFVAGNTCTTTGGTCTIQINSTGAGGVDVHATTDVNVLGTTVTRASGDGLSGDSANAHKNYVASHLVIVKHTQPSPNPFNANFHYTTTGTGYTAGFSLHDGESNTDGGANGLAPGTYTVSEDPLSNWILHSRTCSITSTGGSGTSTFPASGKDQPASITLGIGDTVTCVYTNDWPDGFVTISPLTPKNEVGDPETFTVTVTALPDGASPVAFTSITPSVSPTPNLQNTNTCATPTIDNSNPSLPKATCTVTINSSTAGNFTVHVAAVITIEGVAINRATGDGLGLPSTDSADAVKTYIKASTTLTTKSAPTNLAAGATATVVVTETNTGSGTLTNVNVSGGGKCASFTPSSTTLAAGASADFTCTFTVVGGANDWFADGHGTDELNNAAPSDGEHTSGSVHGVTASTVLSLKSAPSSLVSGATATIVVTETNTGNGTLTGVSVSGGGKCASFTGGATTLAAGAASDYTCTFTVTAGTNSWFADGHGTDELGNAAPTTNEHQSGSVTGLVLPTLTILKSTKGGAATFGWTVTGANPLTPSGNVPSNSSNFQVFKADINVGTNTISENTPPAGWTLTDVSCTGYSGTNAGTPADGAGPLDNNGIPSNWTFTATYGDNVVCSYVNNTTQTTRTQGFWQTHTVLANNIWNGTNMPSGATAVLGSADDSICGVQITAVPQTGANDLMGGFWSSISKLSDGATDRRLSIDQSRMTMLQQYLAAVLNYHMFGSGSESMLSTARAAFCGTDETAIQAQVGILGNFNQSGDSGVFTPGSSATTQLSKSQANIPFWDNPSTPGSGAAQTNNPPVGSLDAAVNANGGGSSVPQNSNIWVSGWAADKKAKGPATKVVVLIDGTPLSNANLGTSRPDVAAALGSSSYTNTGWYLNTSIGSLATGTHSVTAVAYDSTNATTTVGAATITVTVANTPPFGTMDGAVSASGGTSSVAQSSNLWVSGWAADQQDKAPVTKVVVLIDGTPFGNATMGAARPDVASALGSSAYANSGWYLNQSIGSLAAGTHTVTAVAYDSANATTTLGSAQITVTVSNTPPFGSMDAAVNAGNGTSTMAQNSTMWVSGWAADQQDKAPVTKVQIFIDGVAVANATMGTSRPDVASALGSSSYTNSGWWLTYNIGTLSVGTHTVSAVATDSAGASTTLGSAQITVTQ